MRISDWSSDVCSSDVADPRNEFRTDDRECARRRSRAVGRGYAICPALACSNGAQWPDCPLEGRTGCAGTRSEEHTSELQSLVRSSYAVFCLKTKKKK